jgi:hypothetical protein
VIGDADREDNSVKGDDNGQIDSGWPSQTRVDLLPLVEDGSGMPAEIRLENGWAGKIIRSRGMNRAKN